MSCQRSMVRVAYVPREIREQSLAFLRVDLDCVDGHVEMKTSFLLNDENLKSSFTPLYANGDLRWATR